MSRQEYYRHLDVFHEFEDDRSAGFENSTNDDAPETFGIYGTHLLTNDDFRKETLENIKVDNDVLKTLCVTRVSHRTRRLLRHFGDTVGAAEIIYLANEKCKENPCAEVSSLPFVLFPFTSKKGLFATRDILEGEFVLARVPVLLTSPEECGRDRMGLSLPNIILYGGLHSDFSQFKVLNVPPNRKRQRETDAFQIRRKMRAIEAEANNNFCQPQSKYFSDDEEYIQETAYDKYDICIDVTDSNDEMRAIRRNCEPNCVIRYVILHQRIEVFITAQCDISEGDELTLPHDYDSNMSTKILQCTHPYRPNNLCLHEKERQETIKRFVSTVPEKTNEIKEPSTASK
ncbi:hypothetical protein L5515_008053 [Caenorhabditis briggsae]|uniref:SET domain-containing protein n=1 Tax=Caenorhabditis briggsae TaxID=6238 RepID=A0AAE9F6B4_CAEBR|nr:hypothetical protein L3Y34_008202 [Caenorhabditis briggsae]UMM35420.1 hypothetical protein L5515_008053 [Caenorhabditis briggsae]